MARDSLWLFGMDYLEHSSIEGMVASIHGVVKHFL